MTREAITHRMDIEGAYALNEHLLLLKLKSKRGELEQVKVVYGDMYQWMHNKEDRDEICMQKIVSDELFDYFEVIVNMQSRITLYYHFVLSGGGETLYYGHYEFFREPIEDGKFMFVMHYMRQTDRIVVPDWAQNAVVYEIFPERFKNGRKELNPPDVQPWDCTKSGQHIYLGGDIPGITQSFDYLENLGINVIYLTPIFKAGTNHKYNTFDYYEIDPHLGTKEDLILMVQEAHRRGIRVVLDAVFNHCGLEFFAFQDVLKKGEASEYTEWFRIHQFPVEVRDFPDYECYGYYGYMPRFNFGNSDVREYLIGVAEYWIREVDIDGWRLDVAPEVDHTFWREFRQRVKAIKPDVLIIGEVWHDTSAWLRGDEFDSTMNYRFMGSVLDFIAGKINAQTFLNRMATVRGQYALPVYHSVWNLLGSHDTERYLHRIGGDLQKDQLSLALLFTFPGAPMIYYGDEVGMSADKNHNRSGMVWNPSLQNQSLLETYRRWIKLCRSHPALIHGDWSVPLYECEAEGLVVYLREVSEEKILVVINRSESEASVKVEIKGIWEDIFNKQKFSSYKESLEISVLPMNFRLLKN